MQSGYTEAMSRDFMRRQPKHVSALLCCMAGLLAGCSSRTESSAEGLEANNARAANANRPAAPGHTAATNDQASPSGGLVSEAGSVRWDAPGTFRQVAPAYPMRAAQYDVGPEETPAMLTVFANLGGTIQQNADRWVKQFSNPEDSQAPPAANIVARVGDALPITTVSVTGTYRGGPPMMGGGEPKPDMALLGAIVDSPQGLVFFKLTGPADTVRDASADFDELLRSIRLR